MHFKRELTWTHGIQPNTFYMGQAGVEPIRFLMLVLTNSLDFFFFLEYSSNLGQMSWFFQKVNFPDFPPIPWFSPIAGHRCFTLAYVCLIFFRNTFTILYQNMGFSTRVVASNKASGTKDTGALAQKILVPWKSYFPAILMKQIVWSEIHVTSATSKRSDTLYLNPRTVYYRRQRQSVLKLKRWGETWALPWKTRNRSAHGPQLGTARAASPPRCAAPGG